MTKATAFHSGDRVYFAGDDTDSGTVIECYWGKRIDPDVETKYRETGRHPQLKTGKPIQWVRVRWDHCSHCQTPFGSDHIKGCQWDTEDRSAQENEWAVGIDPIHPRKEDSPTDDEVTRIGMESREIDALTSA